MKSVIMVFCLAVLPGAGSALEVVDSDAVREMREAREAFFQGPVLDRPPPGPKFVYSKNFVVHFDTTSYSPYGLTTTRAYAESVAVYAEEAWRLHVDSLGRTPPPPDGKLGGDERTDIYIWWILWGHGVAVPDWQVLDTNGPGTHTSYIEISPHIKDRGALRAAVVQGFEEALDPAALRKRRSRIDRGIPPLSGTREATRSYWEGVALADSGRPEPGPDFVHSNNFVVHFNPSGEHATTRVYAESVAVYAEEAWRVQVDSLGRTLPPTDYGKGGDDRYDIYLRNLLHLKTYLGREQHIPDPGQPDTVLTTYIIVKRDIEFWDILRGTVLGVFDRALKTAAPSSPEKQD